MERKLLVILTTGTEDRGSRATLAFSMGVASLISGVDTTIYMTMGGTFWSRQNSLGKVHIEGFEPLREYVEQYMSLGGKIQICSPCNEFYCSIALGDAPLIEGAQLCGLTHIVDLALDSSVVTL
jgi:predicted peroxiredoxin